jgi:hypothetical protein
MVPQLFGDGGTNITPQLFSDGGGLGHIEQMALFFIDKIMCSNF